MTALPLLDVVSRDGQPAEVHARAASLASRLVEDMVAEFGRIRRIEAEFGSPDWNDASIATEVERSIYSLYHQWAAEAEQVLVRVRRLTAAGLVIDRVPELEDTYASGHARLKLTPEKTARGLEQARGGEFTPAEELRNELRARIRA